MHAALLQEFRKHITLTAEEEELVTASFRYKKVRRNQLLVQPPDLAIYEHYVISGCLYEYYIDDEGIQHTLIFAPEGWWTTDLHSFLTGQESRYHIEALEDTELLMVSKESLDKLLSKVPLLNNYFRILYQNAIIGLEERLLNILSTRVEERYLRFIKKYPQLQNRLPQYFTTQAGLPGVIAFLVIMLEFFGSLFILLGLFTRFFAAASLILFLGMIVTVHQHFGFFMNWYGSAKGEGFEYHLLVIGILLSLIISGADKASADTLIYNKTINNKG